MVNTRSRSGPLELTALTRVVGAYAVVVAATLVALVVLALLAPDQAPDEAWGHAVVVAVFAAVLPLRLRAARRGSGRALTAITVIAAVLVVVNLVEATLAVFPTWMRAEMVAIAALMLVLGLLATRARSGRR